MAQVQEQDETEDDAPVAPEKEPEATVREDDEGNVVVTQPERKTRKERRAERGQSEMARLREERDSLATQLAAQRAAHETVERLRPHLAQPQRQAEPDDPHVKELRLLTQEEDSLNAMYRSGQLNDPSELSRVQHRYREIQDRKEEVRMERAESRVRGRMAPQQQQGSYEETILTSEFGDVIGHQSAMPWARGRYYQLVAEGKPPNLETGRKAMQEAAERFSIRQPQMPPPSAATQAKFGGVSAQAGGRSVGTEVRLDSNQKKMAVSRWPDVDEHVAYRKMADLLRKSQASEPTE